MCTPPGPPVRRHHLPHRPGYESCNTRATNARIVSSSSPVPIGDSNILVYLHAFPSVKRKQNVARGTLDLPSLRWLDPEVRHSPAERTRQQSLILYWHSSLHQSMIMGNRQPFRRRRSRLLPIAIHIRTSLLRSMVFSCYALWYSSSLMKTYQHYLLQHVAFMIAML